MSYLYYRFVYRALMRFTHRYNWHHCVDLGPLDDGSTQKWCQWCGLRDVKPKRTVPPPFIDTTGGGG